MIGRETKTIVHNKTTSLPIAQGRSNRKMTYVETVFLSERTAKNLDRLGG